MNLRVKDDYATLLPPLTTEEFSALEASIKADGVKSPIEVDEDGFILDGNHRFRVAGQRTPYHIIDNLSDAGKRAYALGSNNKRRNLSPDQKRELAKEIRITANMLRTEDPHKFTQKRVATMLGVSREAVSKWWNISNGTSTKANTPDARVKIPGPSKSAIHERVESGESQAQIAADYGISQGRVSQIAKKEKAVVDEKKRREEAAAAIGAESGIHHGDFREIGELIENDSVDLIFTDPPYLADSIHLYADLFAFASRILVPGGWCLAYAGKTFLQEIYRMPNPLTYGWEFTIHHAGGDSRFRKLRLFNGSKPVFGFYKEPLNVWWDWFRDTASGGKEKELHEWQQAEAEAAHFINGLCPSGGLVVDPFCGSGTSLAAAKATGRRWCGFDIDNDAVSTAKARLAGKTGRNAT